MALFLDSVDPEEVRRGMELGIYAGVTTNPKLLAGLDRNARIERLATLAKLCPGLLFFQVRGSDAATMAREALMLREIAPGRTVIKAPMSENALALCGRLRAEGIPVCLTAAFTALQALAAGSAGAHAVALFVGRITRLGGDGVAEAARAERSLTAAGLSTRVLAASVPDADILARLLLVPGIDVTIPCSLQAALLEHPGTAEALAEFKQAEQ